LGQGDEIIATGFARGAAARGKRIAFGDGRRLLWGPWCAEIFRYNPNIAIHADESNIEWISYYKGHRGYNHLDASGQRWIWNYKFKAQPGEFFFDAIERMRTLRRPGSVLLEPNVPWHKSVAVNKDWGRARYQALAQKLRRAGWRVLQNTYGKVRLDVETIAVHSLRDAAATIASVDLVIVPEGGLHHAAAAVGTKAIVIFGGFIPPQVTGYDAHINLTGGAEACGSLHRCDHCRRALEAIEVDHVYALADAQLHQKNSTAPAGAN
jgi:hypothetical protein